MTTTLETYWQVGGKPRGTAPEVGQLYRISHTLAGTFRGVVLAVDGNQAEVEIVSGIAVAYFAEDCRGPGQCVLLGDCFCFFLPEGD